MSLPSLVLHLYRRLRRSVTEYVSQSELRAREDVQSELYRLTHSLLIVPDLQFDLVVRQTMDTTGQHSNMYAKVQRELRGMDRVLGMQVVPFHFREIQSMGDLRKLVESLENNDAGTLQGEKQENEMKEEEKGSEPIPLSLDSPPDFPESALVSTSPDFQKAKEAWEAYVDLKIKSLLPKNAETPQPPLLMSEEAMPSFSLQNLPSILRNCFVEKKKSKTEIDNSLSDAFRVLKWFDAHGYSKKLSNSSIVIFKNYRLITSGIFHSKHEDGNFFYSLGFKLEDISGDVTNLNHLLIRGRKIRINPLDSSVELFVKSKMEPLSTSTPFHYESHYIEPLENAPVVRLNLGLTIEDTRTGEVFDINSGDCLIRSDRDFKVEETNQDPKL